MPRYIRLVRLTEEGVKNVERMGEILAEARKVFEANDGKIVDAYSTLGRYDLVAIVEAPDDATMMKISALVAAGGSVRAETLPAVPIPDFEESVAPEKKPVAPEERPSRARAPSAPKGRASSAPKRRAPPRKRAKPPPEPTGEESAAEESTDE